MSITTNMATDICPLCESINTKTLFPTEYKQAAFYVRECMQCHIAWTVAKGVHGFTPLYDNEQYYGRGENKFVSLLHSIRCSLSRIRAREYLYMVSPEIKKPKILEIGCAEGRLLKSFLELDCECYGVEHVSYPEDRFIDREKIKYYRGDLNAVSFEEGFFNIIILWHVLEHIDNPGEVISKVSNLLAPGGILVLAVPNFSSIEAKIFKQSWFHLDIPWHKYHFTKKSLQYLAGKYHFKTIRHSTFCMEQGPYGIVQSILNSLNFPHNELYEALKGSIKHNRIFSLIIQTLIGGSVLFPCILLSFLKSIRSNGSVLKTILVKDLGNQQHDW